MADAKIEIKVGEVSFVGEGTETWLAAQLEKVIKHLPDLVKVAPPPAHVDPNIGAHQRTPKPAGAKVTLATFLERTTGRRAKRASSWPLQFGCMIPEKIASQRGTCRRHSQRTIKGNSRTRPNL